MSFSSEIKTELSMINNLADKESVKSELLGYLSTSNSIVVDKKIRFSTENEYNINRFGKLLTNLKVFNYQIEIQGKIYTILFSKQNDFGGMTLEENRIRIQDSVCSKNEVTKRSYIRGAFLGSGSINNPKNQYHLEILLSSRENAEILLKSLEQFDISFKLLKRKKEYSVYTKEGEMISQFLALIGANQSVLKFEEIRVIRDMTNNVNRIVNCETANLNKTIGASVKQMSAIRYLKKTGKLNELSDNLREIAQIREENPEDSLTELGQKLKKPIGKSGVNHRLKAIEALVEEMKKQEK